MSQLTAIRLLEAEEPAQPLLEAVRDLAEGRTNQATYQVKPASFRQVPNAPFAYWVSEKVRSLFSELPPFEGDGRTAKQGLATADDFRFVHTTWETPSNDSKQTWFPFAKGGSYSPFYADVYLKVNWGKDGTEIRYFGDPTGVRPKSRPQNSDFYFRPGLTWPLRTTSGMSMRAMPKGCVFAHKGPAAFFDEGCSEMSAFLSLIQTQAFQAIVALQLAAGDAAARSYEVGVIQRTVVPSLDDQSTSALGACAHSAWSIKRSTDTTNQTSHAFYAPALSPGQFGSRRKDAIPA
jgi:hypothetical protein